MAKNKAYRKPSYLPSPGTSQRMAIPAVEHDLLWAEVELNRIMERQVRPNGCGKILIPTPQAAERILELITQLREAGRSWREEKSYYYCPRCAGYHLTRQEF